MSGYRLSSRAAEAEAARNAARVVPEIQDSSSAAVIAGDADIFEWFGGSYQEAGVTVTPATSMRSTAVWRCVTLNAGTMMSAPLGVYERLPNGMRREVPDHPFNRFLQVEPNDDMSGPEFIELQAIAMLLTGNGYGLMRQARNGTITRIDYYPPARVLPFRSTDRSVWYRFTNEDGSNEDHQASYVFHFRGPGRDAGGIKGLSAISHHAKAIGINIATRDYTAGQFERGLLTNDYFSFPENQVVTKEQRAAFKEYLRLKAQGVANAHNPLILENGAEWKRVSITAKDAQLLELLQYSVVDVARIFGTPPHMIGETSAATTWGTGIEQMTIGFKLYTVMPHMRRFAKELTRKLFPIIGARIPNLFVDFDPDALQVGDSKSQGELFSRALGGNQLPGWMSQNEVRRKKNLPPIPGGDRVYFPPETPPAGAQPDDRQTLADDEDEPSDPPPAPRKDPADES
ncbi:phage portal protein [Sphingomonas metalli]|uniref:Phage portal protein n=1 Tax=Sphingomonas metalli TaxID=1779358 RepID=A0A916SWN4_9SPHN|nr:phage portal protein [Sphingomonas metalli]GGB21451.1 phage portal protein [Sphingomonas metalli]